MTPTDSELVRQAQQGQVTAVGQLYDRYYQQIFRFMLSRVRDQAQAEDMTGELFMNMVRALPQYRATAVPFQAWLYRMARNLLIDAHRRAPLAAVSLDTLTTMPMTQENPSTLVEEMLTREQLQQALEQLDPAQQEVLTLRFMAGLPVSEVAQAMEKSVAAVKSLQHRGLLALRTHLGTS